MWCKQSFCCWRCDCRYCNNNNNSFRLYCAVLPFYVSFSFKPRFHWIGTQHFIFSQSDVSLTLATWNHGSGLVAVFAPWKNMNNYTDYTVSPYRGCRHIFRSDNTQDWLEARWTKYSLNIYWQPARHLKEEDTHPSFEFWLGSLSFALSAILSVRPSLLMTPVSQGCNCQHKSMAALPTLWLDNELRAPTVARFQNECLTKELGNV